LSFTTWKNFDEEKLLNVDITHCFDEPTMRWYRSLFAKANPGKNATISDEVFLDKWSFLAEQDGVLRPTCAAILVFGSGEYVRQILPRPVVDMQFYHSTRANYKSGVRWNDRLMVEDNLIKAWLAVVEFYFRHSGQPFMADATTARRDDDPPEYISFREAAINLLLHQDFNDATRLPVIRVFSDQIEFFNPGDAFVPQEQLFTPGSKRVRNPHIVSAFRRIGLADQAGTGMFAIFSEWNKLGYIPPEIENLKAEKSFCLRLKKEKLATAVQSQAA
jgi:ATP-dependent DNA helicase RecG